MNNFNSLHFYNSNDFSNPWNTLTISHISSAVKLDDSDMTTSGTMNRHGRPSPCMGCTRNAEEEADINKSYQWLNKPT